MVSENGEFRGEVKARMAFNDKEHEKIYELIEASEVRLLHAIGMFETPFSSLRRVVYMWNGVLTIMMGIGGYLAVLLIDHLCKK